MNASKTTGNAAVESRITDRPAPGQTYQELLWHDVDKASAELQGCRSFILITTDRDGCIKCTANTLNRGIPDNTPMGKIFQKAATWCRTFFNSIRDNSEQVKAAA